MFIKVAVTNKKTEDKKFIEKVFFFNKRFIRSMIIDENEELGTKIVSLLYEEKPNKLSEYHIQLLDEKDLTLNGENFKIIKECKIEDKNCIEVIKLYVNFGEYTNLLMQLNSTIDF